MEQTCILRVQLNQSIACNLLYKQTGLPLEGVALVSIISILEKQSCSDIMLPAASTCVQGIVDDREKLTIVVANVDGEEKFSAQRRLKCYFQKLPGRSECHNHRLLRVG